MPALGFQFGTVNLTWAEAEARSAEGSFPYPVPLIKAMAEDRGNTTPSASSIAGCLRRFALKRSVGYYVRPTGQLPSIFGTAFHTLMQQHTPPSLGTHIEQHLSYTLEVGGKAVVMRGTMDYLEEGVLVRDYKTKAFIPQGFSPPWEHRVQVDVYNWLASRNGLRPAPRWELVYVSQSWLAKFVGATLPLVEVEGWVRKRLTAWLEYDAAGILPPTLPELDMVDAKDKPVAPCAYCEVREHCLAARRDEQRKAGINPFGV
jgi:hypothetical protein